MRTEVLTTNLFDCFYLRAGAPLVRNLVLLKLCGLKSSLRTYLIVFVGELMHSSFQHGSSVFAVPSTDRDIPKLFRAKTSRVPH
jgi:hypothetical protein